MSPGWYAIRSCVVLAEAVDLQAEVAETAVIPPKYFKAERRFIVRKRFCSFVRGHPDRRAGKLVVGGPERCLRRFY